MTEYQLVRLGVGLIFGGREGQVDILCDRQSASLPVAIGQPTSHVTKYQPVRLWVGQIFGGRRTGSPTTLGSSPGYQHSHWFPLGSDLPDQDQVSDTNELCSLLYTFGTFRDHLQFCIYVASSHILAHTVEKCYTDYVISRWIYTYPSTINLMYHYSKILLSWYYFYHQKSEMLWKNVWKRHIWTQVKQT